MDEQNQKQQKKPSRLSGFLVRLIATLVVLAVGLSLVVLVAFRDRLNLDSAKRWLHYLSLTRSDSGKAEAFRYDGDLSCTFAALDGDLLVCSEHAISLYSGSGTRYINQQVSMENPVVNSNGSLAVVYDAGGSSLYILGQRSLVWTAEGLEGMRVSFLGLIDRETQMMRENQRIVTEMSHDLRTPVTSIMLYTEILKKGKYKGEEQLKSYLEKIERKAGRMKQLTDHLFEYSLVTGETPVVLEEPEWFQVLFYDQVSELCSYLEQRGFRVEARLEWPRCKVQICTDYLARVMDNVASNIVKYADPGEPVAVRSAQEGKLVGFSFENALRRDGGKAESTGIGIQSIGSMMRKMGGSCQVRQEGERFCIGLMFDTMDSIAES